MNIPGVENFPAFLAAGILLNLTPGSDTVYILTMTLSQGKRAGVLSALGISTGGVFHTFAAACGLSMLLMTSSTLFNLVKICGALYLIYLGISTLTSGSKTLAGQGGIRQQFSNRKIYTSGVLTNTFNPKVALFFLAFLPQFINPEYHNVPLSFVILGTTFIFTGTIWCLFLVLFASKLQKRLTSKGNFSRWFHALSGGVFISLGIGLVFSKR